MSYSIRICGDPVLREQSRAVESFDEKLSDFAGHLIKAMREDSGLGIAAPQIGILDRVVAIDRSFGENYNSILTMVNPEIVEADGEVTLEEGCLSVPGIFEPVTRPARIFARYRDVDGNEHEIESDDFLARVIQHETDHLNGILFVDRLSTIKRTMLTKKLRTLANEGTLD